KKVGFYKQLLERLEALPGVDAVAAIAPLPTGGADWHNNFIVEGRPAPPPDQTPLTDIARISPDYFRVMQIQLLRGRYFTDQDGPGAPPVAIVDETFVQGYWPNDDAIGKRIKINLGDWTGPWLTIVGVVGHVKNQGAAKSSRVETYLPYAQSPASWTDFVLRTTIEPLGLASAVRAQVRLLDKDLPVHNIRTVEQQVSRLSATHRLSLILLSIFGGIAFVLAVVGVYGLSAHSVSQRTHEMGIRMAVGAGAKDILRLVVGQGLALTLIGVGVGIAGAFATTQVMSSLLFEVGATDPVTFAGVAALLVAVSLLACYFPARRAAKVDPMVALRHE
ncbi:MAG: FtsX-like permease family protein, partial [Gammaproteobacteria bacterium]